jgi:hypothetical protein
MELDGREIPPEEIIRVWHLPKEIHVGLGIETEDDHTQPLIPIRLKFPRLEGPDPLLCPSLERNESKHVQIGLRDMDPPSCSIGNGYGLGCCGVVAVNGNELVSGGNLRVILFPDSVTFL